MKTEDEKAIAVMVEPEDSSGKATPGDTPAKHVSVWDDEEDAPTGFRKYRAPLIVGILTIGGIAFATFGLSKKEGGPAQQAQVTQVRIMMPPPPPNSWQ